MTLPPAFRASPTPEPEASRPGEIPLPPRKQLSLGRLYALELELAQVVGEARISLTEAGGVLVHVPAEAEGRARELLVLAGELTDPTDRAVS